jgi:catechol 2,3-dioxygenase-like lactoylglutathione lyase family enzyme
MTPPAVFRIGYIDLVTADMPDALAYYTEILGATITAQGDAGAHYLSLGLHHHEIALRRPADGPRSILGFQTSAHVSLADLSKRFGELGLNSIRRRDARPGVADLVAVRVGGHDFEFFQDMEAPAPGFSKVGLAPHRVGHVALLSPDAKDLVRFFVDALGFAETDWFEDMVTFLTCNRDHHVMNIVSAPICKVHHIAFELRGPGQQFQAADLLASVDRPVVWGPSRHTAGHNLASYHYGPDRQLIELYTEMDVYLPDVGYFEPRPWHDVLPQRPRRWPLASLTTWRTPYDFDFSGA